MELEPDGLWITAELSERGQQVLSEHPYIGVSARIVEQYARSDGKFYPAAVQHVLATTDPRIPALGSWQPVNLSNESSVTIDFSNLSFGGSEPAMPALNDRELAEFIEAVSEADAEGYADAGDELSDAELNALMREVDATEGRTAQHHAFTTFDETFSRAAQAAADREAARAEFDMLDVVRPAKRAEDRIARIMAKAEAGLYDGQQQMSFAAEQSAVEIMLANGGAGPCGPVDSYGRCSSRYHELGCMHDQSVDWLASNPPRSTSEAALANLAGDLDLNLTRRTVWDDPDDYTQPGYEVPQATVELAHSLADEWGLLGDGPSRPQGLTARAGPPLSAADALYADMGYELLARPQPSYPGVKELRAQLGI